MNECSQQAREACPNPFLRSVTLALLLIILVGCASLPESAETPSEDGLYVLQLVEHTDGRITSPAPHRAYLVELRDNWLILEPYSYARPAGSWKPGLSQGYLLPVVAPGVAEDQEVLATITNSSLTILFKRHRLSAYYLRS